MSARPGAGGPKLRRLNMGQVFIVLAVISAVLTIFIFKSLISGKPIEKEVEVKTRPLVVAAHQLYSGEVITEDSLKIVDWPTSHYPEASVFEKPENLVGRAVKDTIYPGEPVYKLNLAGEESLGGLPVVIPPGYRAMTILVTENKGVGGFVKPGDMVDVIGTFRFEIPEETQKELTKQSGPLLENNVDVTQTVLQNIRVLAIAQDMLEKSNSLDEPQGDKKEGDSPAAAGTEPTKGKLVSSVTLAVTPEQAEKLAFADERGSLRLSLRPENDKEEVSLLGAVSSDIFSLQTLMEKALQMRSGFDASLFSNASPSPSSAADAPAPARQVTHMAPAAPSREVQVIEGTNTSTVSF